jgi:SAM-dependent methyltransferase
MIKKSYDSGATYAEWQPQEASRRRMWQTRARRIMRHIPSGRLLDIGTGDGHFLAIAREAGFKVEGTELSDSGIAHCRERGFEVFKGQFLDIDLGERHYDAITMWHVLEHVPNPGEVLRGVYQRLNPGGIFAVAVPNEENTLFRHRIHWKRSPNPLGELEWGHEIHLTHFQPATFRAALCSAGFEIVDFDVDDIYHTRSLRNLTVLAGQKFLSRFLGWHFSMAMLCVARKSAMSPAE